MNLERPALGYEEVKGITGILCSNISGFKPWKEINVTVREALESYNYGICVFAARDIQRDTPIYKWNRHAARAFLARCSYLANPQEYEDQLKQAAEDKAAHHEWSWFINYLKCKVEGIHTPSRKFPTHKCPKHLIDQWIKYQPTWQKIKDEKEEGDWLE